MRPIIRIVKLIMNPIIAIYFVTDFIEYAKRRESTPNNIQHVNNAIRTIK
jgi:hypothetical protein